ncbi:MAG: 50S ribosomal protein L23 [Candidatus Melainabacteria bacterium]|jgi:ribosomal protein L23
MSAEATKTTIERKQRAILAPLITFKTTQAAQRKCYTFLVRPSANKYEIAKEFESLFKGKVTRVNTTADRAHKRSTKKGKVRKSDGKKAFIYSDIDLDLFPKLEA